MITLRRRSPAAGEERLSWNDYLQTVQEQFGFGGTQYGTGLQTTWAPSRVEAIAPDMAGHLRALKSCPPAFAAQLVRGLVLSQARFTWRTKRSAPNAGKLFGNQALGLLETPWPNATTGELITKMEWHAGVAGNAFVYRDRPRARLQVLRPDWVRIVLGSNAEPDDAAGALDGELLGYWYCNGGFTSGNDPITLLPEDVAHWSPLPDPEASWRGMSWITPAVRDMQADSAATTHKLRFFENAGTPNLVITGLKAPNETKFKELVKNLREGHEGLANAYKTLFLGEGADATVVGSNLKDLDFKATQGAGETRVAMLSRVPAPILQISEGLAGSSLNAGNFQQARRNFADTWAYPTLQSLCASLNSLVQAPADADLWFDASEMPLLREDAKDQAEIFTAQLAAIKTGVDAGFTAESVVQAINAKDLSRLVHSGLVSVQLQKPGSQASAS